jgi:hypothetical protein
MERGLQRFENRIYAQIIQSTAKQEKIMDVRPCNVLPQSMISFDETNGAFSEVLSDYLSGESTIVRAHCFRL